MATPTPDEVRQYISDYAQNNHLLDAQEFQDIQITLATNLALSEFNALTPLSSYDSNTIPPQCYSVIMNGILYKLFAGQAALLARNHMEYSDGGLTVPIEERMQLYTSLASMYEQDFMSASQRIKAYLNIESGWGEVSSDEAGFPIF